MATEYNPRVTLRHSELDRTTTQPLSAARVLLRSGWEADDEQSAKLLSDRQDRDSGPSESSSRSSKTTKQTSSSTSKSKSASDESEGK